MVLAKMQSALYKPLNRALNNNALAYYRMKSLENAIFFQLSQRKRAF